MLDWENNKLRMKIDLIKGLASVEGNITFDMLGWEKDNSVVLYGTYWGGEEPKGVRYLIIKDYIEMLKDAITIKDVIQVYKSIGFHKI